MSSKNLGKEFKKARKEMGWTQAKVAAKAGMSMNYYSMIEIGRAKNPTREKLESIGKALKIRIEL